MKFKLFGTEIYISFLFCAVIALMLAFDRTGLVIPTLFAAFIHETGHLFTMWVVGCEPKAVKLIPASVKIIKGFPKKKNGDMIIAVSGPLVNLLLFATLYLNYFLFGNKVILNFALLNLVMAVFNMLPVFGLDGGTVLILLLNKKYDIDKSVFTVKLITFIMSIAAFVLGIYLIFTGTFNISVFIVGLYLLLCCLMKY